jgi:hypothetical protein
VVTPGDTCATAIPAVLNNGVFQVSGQLDGFTSSISDRIETTGYAWAGSDVFYALDVTAGSQLSATLNDQGTFDGGIYVFTDCANPVASVIGGVDTTPSRPLEMTVPAAGRIIVAVDAWQASMTTGRYDLRVAVTPAAVAPAAGAPVGTQGDSCSQAAPLPFVNGQATVTGDLAGYTNTSDQRIETTGYSWTGHDVFYALNAAAGERFTIQLDDRSSFDGGVYVVSDCNNIPGSVVGGADTTAASSVDVTATQAGPLYLVVDSWAGATAGNYQLTVRTSAVAAAPAAPAGASLCQVGAGISVLWNGTWYPATVKEVRPDGCFIGYDGFASSWDEAVGADRMRAR